jgi:hypothetical protein
MLKTTASLMKTSVHFLCLSRKAWLLHSPKASLTLDTNPLGHHTTGSTNLMMMEGLGPLTKWDSNTMAAGSLKGKHANAENSLVNSSFPIISVSTPPTTVMYELRYFDIGVGSYHQDVLPGFGSSRVGTGKSKNVMHLYLARHGGLLTAALSRSEVLQEIAYGRGREAVTLYSPIFKRRTSTTRILNLVRNYVGIRGAFCSRALPHQPALN